MASEDIQKAKSAAELATVTPATPADQPATVRAPKRIAPRPLRFGYNQFEPPDSFAEKKRKKSHGSRKPSSQFLAFPSMNGHLFNYTPAPLQDGAKSANSLSNATEPRKASSSPQVGSLNNSTVSSPVHKPEELAGNAGFANNMAGIPFSLLPNAKQPPAQPQFTGGKSQTTTPQLNAPPTAQQSAQLTGQPPTNLNIPSQIPSQHPALFQQPLTPFGPYNSFSFAPQFPQLSPAAPLNSINDIPVQSQLQHWQQQLVSNLIPDINALLNYQRTLIIQQLLQAGLTYEQIQVISQENPLIPGSFPTAQTPTAANGTSAAVKSAGDKAGSDKAGSPNAESSAPPPPLTPGVQPGLFAGYPEPVGLPMGVLPQSLPQGIFPSMIPPFGAPDASATAPQPGTTSQGTSAADSAVPSTPTAAPTTTPTEQDDQAAGTASQPTSRKGSNATTQTATSPASNPTIKSPQFTRITPNRYSNREPAAEGDLSANASIQEKENHAMAQNQFKFQTHPVPPSTKQGSQYQFRSTPAPPPSFLSRRYGEKPVTVARTSALNPVFSVAPTKATEATAPVTEEQAIQDNQFGRFSARPTLKGKHQVNIPKEKRDFKFLSLDYRNYSNPSTKLPQVRPSLRQVRIANELAAQRIAEENGDDNDDNEGSQDGDAIPSVRKIDENDDYDGGSERRQSEDQESEEPDEAPSKKLRKIRRANSQTSQGSGDWPNIPPGAPPPVMPILAPGESSKPTAAAARSRRGRAIREPESSSSSEEESEYEQVKPRTLRRRPAQRRKR